MLSADRRNYKNVFDALFRIIREEGLFTLWRGAIPTMGRAMVVNAAQLASYSQAKQALLDTGTWGCAIQPLDILVTELSCSCCLLLSYFCFSSN